MHHPIVTCFGIGRLPTAPGTWASVAAIPLAWLLHAIGGFWLVCPATVALGGAAYWAIGEDLRERLTSPGGEPIDLEWDSESRAFASPRADDPSEIVIDELVGMLIALWPLSLGLTLQGAGWTEWPWPGWLLGFALFRFFDIVKPPPVSWAERVPGAIGIMLDDIVAGGLTALIVLVAAGVAHGWL